MQDNIAEEIKIKLKSIENELNEKRWSNNKAALWVTLSGLLVCLVIIYLYSFVTNRTEFYPLIIFVMAGSLAGNAITRYTEHKKFSKLFMNAFEIINYYTNKKTK